VNPAELWDEAARRQRALARRHERLNGLNPGTPAYEHQVDRVFVATDELIAVLDEIESLADQRRLTGAAALIPIALVLAAIAAAGTIPVVLWVSAAVTVLAAAMLALSTRWRSA
jgi:hypothetical protein